jgi:hypothetical protein
MSQFRFYIPHTSVYHAQFSPCSSDTIKTLMFKYLTRWVFLLSDVLSVILPESNDVWIVEGGEFGVMFASDTTASEHGHENQVLGSAEAILLQIPRANGDIPQHLVIHAGLCNPEEVTGLRGVITRA